LSNTREFFENLVKNVKAGLEAAGYRAIFQSSQKWPASFQASSSSSQGGVTLFFGYVCESCGESLPYRVVSANGAFNARVAIPKDCDAATAADNLLREVLPLMTNRLPAATKHNTGVGVGLLTPQESGKIAAAIESHAAAH